MNLIIERMVVAIRRNWRTIAIFEIVFRTIQIGVLVEIGNNGLKFALRKANYSYLTSGNMLNFISRPYTLGLIILLVALLAISISFEVSVLVSLYQASLNRKKLGIFELIYRGIKKYKKFLSRDGINIVFLIMSTYIFYSLFPIIRLIALSRPIVSLLNEAIAFTPVIIVFICIVLILLVLLAPNIFAGYGYLIELITKKEAREKSKDIIKRLPFETIGLLILINIVITIVLIIIYFVFVIGVAIIVAIFANENHSVAIMQVAGSNIELFLIFIGAIIYSVVNNAFFVVSYCKHTFIRSIDDTYEYNMAFWSKVQRQPMLVVAIVSTLTYLVVMTNVLLNVFSMSRSVFGETYITAHRGSSIDAPENTLPAIQLAIDELADYVEIDLQETKDGVVILFHDNSLRRVTGVNDNVWNLTYEEIKTLNATGEHGDEYEYVHIPTLEEALELCKGKVRMNIELKDTGNGQNLTAKTMELIEEYQMEQYCVISSTSLRYLAEIKAINPDIKTGYIILAGYGNYFDEPEVDFISIRSSFVNKNLITEAHLKGKEVHAWTVNSKSELERLSLLSVDNIITDRPAYAREILFQEDIGIGIFGYIMTRMKW